MTEEQNGGKAEAYPGRASFTQRDGKTYFHEKECVTVLKGWPAPQAWQCLDGGPWKCVREAADTAFTQLLRSTVLDLPEDWVPDFAETGEERRKREEGAARWARLYAWEHAVATRFFESTPARVVAVLRQVNHRRWSLFNLLARCPGADDLAESNPALCFALANCGALRKPAAAHPLREARRLVRLRQRDIAGWLGFPATQSACRILAKVHAGSVSLPRLFRLRRLMRDPALNRTFQHLPAINCLILDVLVFPMDRQHIGPSFLHDLAAANMGPLSIAEMLDHPLSTLAKTLRMARQLNYSVPPVFRSREHLRAVHERLILAHDVPSSPEEAGIGSFPPPPLPGTSSIRPLTTSLAIRQEAEAMHHCARHYQRAVAAGQSYLYRVLKPVRATLEIRHTPEGWAPGQLRGRGDAGVPGTALRTILESLFGRANRSRASVPCAFRL